MMAVSDALAAVALSSAITAALAMLALALLLALIRAALGPRAGDRLLALQLGWTVSIALFCALCLAHSAWVYLDLALTLALLGGLLPLASSLAARRRSKPKDTTTQMRGGPWQS